MREPVPVLERAARQRALGELERALAITPPALPPLASAREQDTGAEPPSGRAFVDSR